MWHMRPVRCFPKTRFLGNRNPFKPGFHHKPFTYKFFDPLLIQFRPSAIRLSWRKFSHVSIFIESFDDAVYPAKTQSLFDRRVILKRRPARVLFIKDKPDSRILAMIFRKPFSPFGSVCYVDLFHSSKVGLMIYLVYLANSREFHTEAFRNLTFLTA
jgi:hypothetical protein